MIDVVIDRSRWSTYLSTDKDSMLLNPETGKMCCMGFMCLAAGSPEEDLCNMLSPLFLKEIPEQFLEKSGAVGSLMNANDLRGIVTPQGDWEDMLEQDPKGLPQEDREDMIIKIAATIGFRVTFEGELT